MTLKQNTSVQNVAMNGKYKVPSMDEIRSLEWNGYNVVSTFSGGGGSCLGYRMAGYKVLYANEFVEEAQKTYRANHDTYLDTRDIRTVTAEDILAKTGLKKGELDLFDGSPPCSAFSTAGIRDKGWGKVKTYSDSAKTAQRVDDLFFEYTRLLNGLQPKVFVAENVSGLVKGKAKGYFKIILQELKKCGYEVKASLLNAMYLGVPQSRERLIFCGVRNDIVEKYGVHPCYPAPMSNVYTLHDAICDIVNDEAERQMLLQTAQKYSFGKVLRKLPKNPKKIIDGSAVTGGSFFSLKRCSMYTPCGTICQMNGMLGRSGNCHPIEDRKLTIAEVKRVMSVPDDFVLTGDFEQKWERLGRMVPPLMMKAIAKNIEENILCKIK